MMWERVGDRLIGFDYGGCVVARGTTVVLHTRAVDRLEPALLLRINKLLSKIGSGFCKKNMKSHIIKTRPFFRK